jgi:hypothetical protein
MRQAHCKIFFKKAENIPNEIVIPYFAILKAIELGVEKQKKS